MAYYKRRKKVNVFEIGDRVEYVGYRQHMLGQIGVVVEKCGSHMSPYRVDFRISNGPSSYGCRGESLKLDTQSNPNSKIRLASRVARKEHVKSRTEREKEPDLFSELFSERRVIGRDSRQMWDTIGNR